MTQAGGHGGCVPVGSLLYQSLVRRAVREGNGGAHSYLTTWVGVAELEGFDFP